MCNIGGFALDYDMVLGHWRDYGGESGLLGRRIITTFGLLIEPIVLVAQLIVHVILALLFLPKLLFNPKEYCKGFGEIIEMTGFELKVLIALPMRLFTNLFCETMDERD